MPDIYLCDECGQPIPESFFDGEGDYCDDEDCHKEHLCGNCVNFYETPEVHSYCASCDAFRLGKLEPATRLYLVWVHTVQGTQFDEVIEAPSSRNAIRQARRRLRAQGKPCPHKQDIYVYTIGENLWFETVWVSERRAPDGFYWRHMGMSSEADTLRKTFSLTSKTPISHD